MKKLLIAAVLAATFTAPSMPSAGVGAIGGAVVGAIAGHHRAGRGALIGAGTGALFGTGLGMFRHRQMYGTWF